MRWLAKDLFPQLSILRVNNKGGCQGRPVVNHTVLDWEKAAIFKRAIATPDGVHFWTHKNIFLLHHPVLEEKYSWVSNQQQAPRSSTSPFPKGVPAWKYWAQIRAWCQAKWLGPAALLGTSFPLNPLEEMTQIPAILAQEFSTFAWSTSSQLLAGCWSIGKSASVFLRQWNPTQKHPKTLSYALRVFASQGPKTTWITYQPWRSPCSIWKGVHLRCVFQRVGPEGQLSSRKLWFLPAGLWLTWFFGQKKHIIQSPSHLDRLDKRLQHLADGHLHCPPPKSHMMSSESDDWPIDFRGP